MSAARGSTLVAVAVCAWAALSGSAAGEPRFRAHLIDKFPAGYQVTVTDINGDGLLDIVGLSTRHATLAWYQNPGWARHRIEVAGKQFIDLAPADIDGDGRVDLALATDFAMQNSETGRVHWITRGAAGETWTRHDIAVEPSSHRLRWADVDGDGTPELVDVPLLGRGATAPEYAVPAQLVLFRRDGSGSRWIRELIDDQLHVIHGLRVVQWDRDRAQELLMASFEGVHLYDYDAKARRWRKTFLVPGDQASGPSRGASEVVVGRLGRGRRFLATVEPWHGHQTVVYLPGAAGRWTRRVLDDSLANAHAIDAADFDGDGRDEIVAGYRGEGRRLLLYRSQDVAGRRWERTILDDGDMATSGVFIADLNRDARPDIVAIGSASGNIKWFENLGAPDLPRQPRRATPPEGRRRF